MQYTLTTAMAAAEGLSSCNSSDASSPSNYLGEKVVRH